MENISHTQERHKDELIIQYLIRKLNLHDIRVNPKWAASYERDCIRYSAKLLNFNNGQTFTARIAVGIESLILSNDDAKPTPFEQLFRPPTRQDFHEQFAISFPRLHPESELVFYFNGRSDFCDEEAGWYDSNCDKYPLFQYAKQYGLKRIPPIMQKYILEFGKGRNLPGFLKWDNVLTDIEEYLVTSYKHPGCVS